MIPAAYKLLQKAKSGERLTTKERRHVITWMQATSGDGTDESFHYTGSQLGELFGVTERTIRLDKMAFRKDKAKLVKDEDVGLIIADIALDYERQLRDIERSKDKAQLGSMAYLRHCTDAMNLRLQMVKALQDLGYYPKNLGQITVNKWDFKAHVDTITGYVTTSQSSNHDYPTIEGTIENRKSLMEENNAEEDRTIEEVEFSTKDAVHSRPVSFTSGSPKTIRTD